jgi:Bacterial SH3 domain/PEGA domain
MVLGGMYIFKPRVAGISIDTSPSSLVYINGKEVGKTPYNTTREPGEILIKLIPESFEQPLLPYETKVDLIDGVKTVVHYSFARELSQSSAYIVSFEKSVDGIASLAIISDPTDASIVISEKVIGNTPHKETVDAKEHTVVIKKEGYKDLSLPVKTVNGYKLTAWVKLMKGDGLAEDDVLPVATQSADITITPSPTKPNFYVQVSETGTGFLRVRKEPSTVSAEIGTVDPGMKYVFIEQDIKSGWFKIQFDEGKEGWISSQYAKKVNN